MNTGCGKLLKLTSEYLKSLPCPKCFGFLKSLTAASFLIIGTWVFDFSALASTICPDKGLSVFHSVDCGTSQGNLRNLFGRQIIREKIGTPAVATDQNIQKIPFPTRRPHYTKKAKIQSFAAHIRLEDSANLKAKYAERIGDKEVQFVSLNDTLSEFGPTKNPAKLRIRCDGRKVNVLLEFPGFPMTPENNARNVSFKIDNGQVVNASFSGSSDFFTVGIWKHRDAMRFLRLLSEGERLFLNTQDSEETDINAIFDVRTMSKYYRKLKFGCVI